MGEPSEAGLRWIVFGTTRIDPDTMAAPIVARGTLTDAEKDAKCSEFAWSLVLPTTEKVRVEVGPHWAVGPNSVKSKKYETLNRSLDRAEHTSGMVQAYLREITSKSAL